MARLGIVPYKKPSNCATLFANRMAVGRAVVGAFAVLESERVYHLKRKIERLCCLSKRLFLSISTYSYISQQ